MNLNLKIVQISLYFFGKIVYREKTRFAMEYCEIRHQIKGRVRLVIPIAAYNKAWFAYIEHALLLLDCVDFVRANTKCNSLIIRHSLEKFSLEEILKNINLSLETLIKETGEKPACCKQQKVLQVEEKCNCAEASTDTNIVRSAFLRFAATSVVMGGVFLRSVLFNTAVAQTAFSPLGIAGILFSLPLLKTAYKQAKEKRIALEGFLGAGCIATIFTSQALAAFEILWINAGAELLTAWVTERSRKSISKILQDTTHHAFTFVDGIEVETKITDIKENDVVVLHTGEKVCIDGEVVNGYALLDESPISGRNDLVQKSIGDTVLAGTFVSQGIIYVCAKSVGDKTYLSRVLCLVEDSLANKAPIENVADKLAKRLIFMGFVATGATFLLTGSFTRAFTVLLVMACPCATVLSASTAVSASMSTAARKNILIKGGKYLESIGKVDCVCFDKTGTLTTSEPILSDVVILKKTEEKLTVIKRRNIKRENTLLQLVLSTEMHNHHPIANAIKKEAEQRGIVAIPHTCCEYFPGMGISATVDNKEILVGNHKLMEQRDIEFSAFEEVQDQIESLRLKGKTVLFIAQDRELISLFALDNPMRPEAKNVIETLKKSGAKSIYLITGDEENTARTLSERLGVTGYFASVIPTEKADIVRKLQEKHGSVLMVGDGINDAVALAHADVGIAMGANGSEVAIESADITLVNDDLCGIVYVHQLSKKTVDIAYQNFWIATGSNVVGVALGALGILSPVMAGGLHIVHTLGVLANSSRLLSYKAKPLFEECLQEKELFKEEQEKLALEAAELVV